MTGLPTELSVAATGVVRPRDLRGRYANPRKEFSRLVAAGALLRLAHGYYALVPERYRGTSWRPPVEAAGLAVAQVDYGTEHAVAMGVTAARLLGAVPRALGAAVIAIPRQRPPLVTTVGRLWFVKRDVGILDVQRVETELSSGLITSPEQTLLDLADRPRLGDLQATDVAEALRRLAESADWRLVGRLARDQRKRPAAVRAATVLGVEPPVRASRPPKAAGLWAASVAQGPGDGTV